MSCLNKKRKAVYIGGIAVFLLCCVCFAGYHMRIQEYSIMNFTAFDTLSEIKAYSREDQTENLKILNDLLIEWHALFDIYETHEGIPNLKTINDAAGKYPVEVDDRILRVLEQGIEIEKMTQGRCNVVFGSVLSVWHEYREQGKSDVKSAQLPPQERLQQAEKHTDLADLVLDMDNKTVYLKDAEMSLDVGAIAKGYAADALAEKAKELGMDSVMINLGGNILTIGNKKDCMRGSDWVAGIQNPDLEAEVSYLYKLPLNDGALVTSGDYQRFYEVDGKRYSHIIDPDTLYPPQRYRSVTVLAPASGMADALSTALFIADLEDGKKMLSNAGEGYEAVWILLDGSVEMTDGIKSLLRT